MNVVCCEHAAAQIGTDGSRPVYNWLTTKKEQIMKIRYLALGLAAFSVIALNGGCGKKETATPPIKETERVKAPDTSAADAAKATELQKAADAQKALDAQKAEADKAAQAIKDQAAADKLAAETAAADKQAQLATAQATAQESIDTAKSLAGQSKWAEVLQTLAALAGQNLTPTQQGVVDGLKTEAQKQAAAAAVKSATDQGASAVGGLLKPKK
jgi:hypothetical protein